MPDQRFHLFAGKDYYPDGGACDHVGIFDTQEEAERFHVRMDPNWLHIAVCRGAQLVIIRNRRGRYDWSSHRMVYGEWEDGAYER